MNSDDAIKFAQKLMDTFLVSTKHINIVAMKTCIFEILKEHGKLLIGGMYHNQALDDLEYTLFITGDHDLSLGGRLYKMLEKKFFPSCSECKCILRGKFVTCRKCKGTCCKSCSVELKDFGDQDYLEDITCCATCYKKVLDTIKS